VTTADGTILGTTKLVDNGPPSLRLNLVIMGDGYQGFQMLQYEDDVQRFVNTMFSTPPFDEFRLAINVYRVDVSSTDSGADDPTACGGTGATRRTYFDASFCGDGIRRALEVNEGTALVTASSQVPQWHAVLVVVNSTIEGGKGGPVGTYSLATGAEQMALHEMGHTVFHLADEYEYYRGCTSGETDRNFHPPSEPAEVNVTINTSRSTLKWRQFIAATTPIPTTRNTNCAQCDPQSSPVAAGTVGLFEGAHTYHCRAFRPEFNCKMRKHIDTAGNPIPFCRVCREHIREVMAPFSRGRWGSTDLTSFVFGAANAEGDPIAYVTDFPGQGPTAHVAYSTANRIHELFYDPASGGWANADLLGFGGPAVGGDPIVYIIDFPGQGPTARIVYHSTSGHVWELSYIAASGGWDADDLTFRLSSPPSAGDPFAYVTDFPGEGPTARIVYRSTGSGDIYELSYDPATGGRAALDLTALTGGPPAAGDPIAYVTDSPGQAPTAHFVYRADDGDVHELFYIAARVPDSPN
jgi:IgA Peptidase M64